MIVVTSHPGAPHATRVVDRLRSWGREVFVLDIADFPDTATLSVDFGEPDAPRASVTQGPYGVVDVSAATAVWWGRPQLLRLVASAGGAARGFAHG